jgi:ribosomal protein S18 acetylase RimI-like enzyme
MIAPAQNLESQVQIRSAIEADVPFIFNSWLKSYRGANSVKCVGNPVYFEFQHKVIERLLQRSQVYVLCSPEDSSQVFGYVVCEHVEDIPVLHYVYVKYAFRGMGLCSMLLNHAKLNKQVGGFYTHDTHSATKLLKNSKFVYNPYLS